MSSVKERTVENFHHFLEVNPVCPKCGSLASAYGRMSDKDDVILVTCSNMDCNSKFQVVCEKPLRGISHYRDIVDCKDPKEVQRVMSNYVNSFGSSHPDFIKEMARDHRTLQQNFTRLCLEWIKHLSETEYYDGRNSASVEVSKRIMKSLDNDIYLPLV